MRAITAASVLSGALLWPSWASAAPKALKVELGKEFRLKKGETASLPDGKTTLKITGFVNSPCPKGAMCVWSGLDVIYELRPDASLYDVTTKSSDYRTYAVLLVDDPELACARQEPVQRGECLRSLANQRRSAALCRKIEDARTRGFCLEEMAEELGQDGLCKDVANPTQHCLYLRSKAAGDLAACDGIVTFRARARCFRELSVEGGGGPASCSSLGADLAGRCKELATGPAQ